VDERDTTDQSKDQIFCHRYHNVESFIFESHPINLRNWIYINKFSKVRGNLDFYDPYTFYPMIGVSGMASLFLLCDTNDCSSTIEDIKWSLDKYRYSLANHYAFIDKLEDNDVIVKRFATVPKPVIFIVEYKHKELMYYRLSDNIEQKYKDQFSEHDIEEFIRRYSVC
jgi:hypothetical protein